MNQSITLRVLRLFNTEKNVNIPKDVDFLWAGLSHSDVKTEAFLGILEKLGFLVQDPETSNLILSDMGRDFLMKIETVNIMDLACEQASRS